MLKNNVVAFLVCFAGCALADPPEVTTLTTWVKADREMGMVGVTFHFDHLLPGRGDISRTADELLAVVDYYRYPQIPVGDIASADSGMADVDPLATEYEAQDIDAEGRGVGGWAWDNKWAIGSTVAGGLAYLYADEIQDAYDSATNRDDELSKEEAIKKNTAGAGTISPERSALIITAQKIETKSLTSITEARCVQGSSGSGECYLYKEGRAEPSE